jgi:hypothetical protein
MYNRTFSCLGYQFVRLSGISGCQIAPDIGMFYNLGGPEYLVALLSFVVDQDVPSSGILLYSTV